MRCLVLLILFAGVAHAYDIIGTVTDADGAVIPDADVWLSQDRSIQSARSDGRGRFRFTGVEAGPIELVARRGGWSIGGIEGQIIDNVTANIVLGVPDTIRIRAIDGAGEPVAGARLKTMLVGSRFHVPVADLVEHGYPSVRSDENGVLEIRELPKDSHAALSIVHRRFAEYEIPTIPVGTELDVRMLPGQRLRGRITGEGGQAIERARVSVFRADKEFTEVLTDREGYYSALVPPGQYRVAVRHPGYAMPDPVPAQPVENGDGAVADLVMPPPHIVRGTVVDTEGAPVPATRIAYIAREILFEEAVSDVEGRFDVTVSAGEGILRVLPPPRMYTVASPDIQFALTEQRVVELGEIELESLPEIEGNIEVPNGVARNKVLIATVGLRHEKRAITDSAGNFAVQLDAMPYDERVRLRAEHAFRFLHREFEIDLRNIERQSFRLQQFKPDLSPPPEKPPNKLNHMIGEPAPDVRCSAWFNLPETMNGNLSLEDLRGKVVVLTMWGGWDYIGKGPDRTDELNRLYELFKNQDDVAFVSVHDASTSAEEVEQFANHYNIHFPVGRDEDPTLTFDAYNVNTIPQTVLIDKQGILRYFYVDGRILELIKDLRRK